MSHRRPSIFSRNFNYCLNTLTMCSQKNLFVPELIWIASSSFELMIKCQYNFIMLIYCIIIVLMTHFWVHKDYMSKTAPTKEYVAYSNFLRAFFMGLNCLYMINWLLSTFCLFVWRCLVNLKKLGCNSARSTLGIPSGASGRCRSSRLPDVMPFSRGGQGSDRWASAWLEACIRFFHLYCYYHILYSTS